MFKFGGVFIRLMFIGVWVVDDILIICLFLGIKERSLVESI